MAKQFKVRHFLTIYYPNKKISLKCDYFMFIDYKPIYSNKKLKTIIAFDDLRFKTYHFYLDNIKAFHFLSYLEDI